MASSTEKNAKKPERYNADFELRTAHDVRKIAVCSYCTGMGDKNHMIPEGKSYTHGRCFAVRDGLKAILALPKDVTDCLTIGDIGGPVMKALLKKHYGH